MSLRSFMRLHGTLVGLGPPDLEREIGAALDLTGLARLQDQAYLGTCSGTDQMMVQRYLSARSRRDAARALGVSGFIVLVQFALFLLIGVALAAFFTLNGERATLLSSGGDRLFATFIVLAKAALIGTEAERVFGDPGGEVGHQRDADHDPPAGHRGTGVRRRRSNDSRETYPAARAAATTSS